MQKRRAASHLVRWALLAACLVIAFALARLFWAEASDGRDARETGRVEDLQGQVQDAAPAPSVPAAPAQQ